MNKQEGPVYTKRDGWLVLGLFGTVGLLYGQILGNYFLNDDFGRILDLQPLQRASSAEAFVSLFAESYHGAYYRPLTNIAFYLLRKCFGLEAWAYYLSSLLLHFLAATALYAGLRRLRGHYDSGDAFWCGAGAAVFFLVNPRHVESVSYVHDNENILCGLFFFLGFNRFVDYCVDRRPSALGIFAVYYMGSLLGKEMGVTLPLACFAYYVILGRQQQAETKPLLRDPVPYATAAVAAAVFALYMVLRYQGLGAWVGGVGPTGDLSFSVVRMARTAVQAYIAMVIPNDLPFMAAAADYFREHIGLFLAIGAAVGGAGLWILRKLQTRLFWFGMAWSLLTLLPVLNNGIGVDVLTGGRYLYIPLAGMAISLAALAARIAAGRRLAHAALVLVLFYSACTYSNNNLMVRASDLNERFLANVEMMWRQLRGADSAVLIPGMYKGVYILPGGFDKAVALLYGDTGLEISASVVARLVVEIEDYDNFQMEIGEAQGGDRNLHFRGGGVLWTRESDQPGVVERAGLKFQSKKSLNARGDFLADRVALKADLAVWAPAFTRQEGGLYALPR